MWNYKKDFPFVVPVAHSRGDHHSKVYQRDELTKNNANQKGLGYY